ncbi:hypothetical protein MPTK1_4g09910 [Marchantia polymorpha subsp. ruderalis]|uniref:Uncharacterized protein n=2 Tax=Marchantia polymorpha TaxID=3197 RepID=A0AAF6B897_MARPO|nr:hypothetical protein MARPO_0132s0034 [Marchantia polymorpha]BBN08231.1 hypothetical protein Mp_4g09910 [Marchantia polymorpha subsp. ruderalis]|eukprot:PTQ29961.1 hypothetical protein MARPO_0132s0034 [Marchantia polymorpha]
MPWPWEMPMINTYELYPWKKGDSSPSRSCVQKTPTLVEVVEGESMQTVQDLMIVDEKEDSSDGNSKQHQGRTGDCFSFSLQSSLVSSESRHDLPQLGADIGIYTNHLQPCLQPLRGTYAPSRRRICCAGLWSWLVT